MSASASRALTRPLWTRRSLIDLEVAPRTCTRAPARRAVRPAPRVASALDDPDGRAAVGVAASEQRRAGRAPLGRASGDRRCERPGAGLCDCGPRRTTWSLSNWRGLVGLVMAPSRQTGFPKRFLERFPNRSPARNFFGGVFPGQGHWEPLLGSRSGTLWNLAGGLRAGLEQRLGQGVGLGVGIAPAGVTPLAVVVEVGRSPSPADVVGSGLAQRREGGREADALGGELARVAEGVGVVAQAQRGEVPAAPERPGRLDHGHDVGAECQAFDLGPGTDPMGQPRRPVRRLGGVLGHVGGDGRGVGVVMRRASTRTSCWAPQRARRSAVPSTVGTGTPTSDDDPADGLGQDRGVEPRRRRLGSARPRRRPGAPRGGGRARGPGTRPP